MKFEQTERIKNGINRPIGANSEIVWKFENYRVREILPWIGIIPSMEFYLSDNITLHENISIPYLHSLKEKNWIAS